jgi:hypothetical protein
VAVIEVAVKPFRVAQAMRVINGISETYLDTGDSEMFTAFSLAIACIAEGVMAEATEEERHGHRKMCLELLRAVDEVEMELAKSEATQPEARA